MTTTPNIPSLSSRITHIAKASTVSTNDDAKALARGDTPHLTLITATEQKGGKGRQGRVWFSPPGNIYASLILRPAPEWPDIGTLSLLTALALYDTLSVILPARAIALKWPNDILASGQKISGILIEAGGAQRSGDKATADWVVIGMGMNVANHPTTEMRYPVTSCAAEGGPQTPQDVLPILINAFIDRLDAWCITGFAAIKQDYLAVAHNLGEDITIQNGEVTTTGQYQTITDEGHLVLRQENGTEAYFAAGEIIQPASS